MATAVLNKITGLASFSNKPNSDELYSEYVNNLVKIIMSEQ